jgi:Phytanoyl-CoA dioxygenase (PhyH)
MPMMTTEQLASHQAVFAEQGYVKLEGVVPREPLARLTQELSVAFDRASRDGSLFQGGGLITGHLNCFPGEGARALYPKPFDGPFVGCNLNLPGSVAQHYHVDGTFLGQFLVVNVALVDTDLVNGAIDVLPGTHREYYPFWRLVLERKARLTTRLPLRQGDVLVRTSTLWHRGMPNLSKVPRPMVAFTFGDPGTTPLPDPFMLHGGQITFTPNWYRPTLLGRLRERTFAAAPVTYDAWRFVRSLLGPKGYAS